MRNPLIATCLLMLALSAIAQAAQPTPQGSADQPVATIETSMGNLTCVLFPKAAPLGTATFPRVIPEFMIQGGDPAGNGAGTIGFKFKNETWPDLHFDQPGRLAYANAGPDTNGSQFFITEAPYPSLAGNYPIFGQCDAASVELVKKIARMPSTQDRPNTPIVIKHIRIDDGTKAKSPLKKAATPAQ